MSAIAKAAAYLTEHGVSSISPGMGMFLVRVADGVKAARAALPSLSPAEALTLAGPLEEYEKALNTISIMACHQQVSVIGVLQAALRKEGLG
jgi:hypothetical protein